MLTGKYTRDIASVIQQRLMKIITKEGTKKVVKIVKCNESMYKALLVHKYNGEQDVLAARNFLTIKGAERWADKVLAQHHSYDQFIANL